MLHTTQTLFSRFTYFLCSFVDVPFTATSAFFFKLELKWKSKSCWSVLEFFEKERDGKARINLTRPMERLAEATGLDRFQIYYILHRQGKSPPKPSEKVSQNKVGRLLCSISPLWSAFTNK